MRHVAGIILGLLFISAVEIFGDHQASAAALNLSWTQSSTVAQQVEIQRCLGAACSNFTNLATIAATLTTYQDSTLNESVTACYRVRNLAGAQQSAFGNTACGTSALNAITNLVVTPGP